MKLPSRTVKIWLILIVIHILFYLAGFVTVNMLDIQEINYAGVLVYVTVTLIDRIGLPVFENPNSGWGWPDPNLFGWILGVLSWILIYFLLALLLALIIEKFLSFKKSQ